MTSSNRSVASAPARLWPGALWGLGAWACVAWGATVYENDAVRVEFLEVGKVDAAGVEVPLRFEVENRGPVRIRGTLDVGGPTRGILPRSEPSQPFAVEPGEMAEIELKVSFAEDCVNGFYPVHAFFLLEEGRGDRGILTRLVRPSFAAPKAKGVEDPSARIATFRPPPVENAVDRFFETRRLSVMADYARSLDEGAGRAFRLGPEEGAYRVLVVPGRLGLLDGYLYFSGPQADLYFRGLRVALEGPEGVEVGREMEVVEAREEKRSNGFAVSHQVRLGEWESLLNVEVAIEGGEVKLRCDSPDRVVEVALGEASLAPAALTAGAGYRFCQPRNLDFCGASPFLNVRFAQFEFAGGVRMTMGSDEALRAVRVIRNEGVASVAVAGGQWLRVIPEGEGLPRLAANRNEAERSGTAARGKVPAIWFHRICRDPEALEREIKDWGRCEAGPVGLLLDGWQAGGQQGVPPDVWPPGEQAGGAEGLRRLAEICREAGVLLVLNDDYREISPAARGFQFDAVEFGEDGQPVESRSGPPCAYAMRPDAALAYFEENWKQIQFHVKPGAVCLGGVDATGHEFWDRGGSFFPAKWVRERWRANAGTARKVAGESAAVLAGGGGDWLAGEVDALVVPRLSGLPDGTARVPWWVLFQGGGTRIIEEFGEEEGAELPQISEWVAAGRLPLFGDSTWPHEALRRSWLLRSVLEQLEGRRVVGFQQETDSQRFLLEWDSGLRIWRNGESLPWQVDGLEVPPGGFWVEGPGLRGGTEVFGGVLCEILETSQERSIYPARQPVQRYPVRLRIDSLTQLSADLVELVLRWERPELVPPGCWLRFYLAAPGEPEKAVLWGKEGLKIGETVPSRVPLPAGEVPAGPDWEVFAALENDGGRRLPIGSRAGGAGNAASGLVRLGRVRRLEEEIARWEANWQPDAGADEVARAAPERTPVDFAWGVAAGAFRLKRAAEIWRLFPLPDQREFEVKLRLAQIDGMAPEISELTAWPRGSVEPKKVDFQLEDGCLVFQVEPEVLVYDLAPPPTAREP